MKSEDKRNKLLLIGSPRSGTSLIASMVGAHPEIGVLIEDMHFTIEKIGGKKIIANKLCLPQQLDIDRKANLYSRIMQRLGFLENYPRANYSLNDYIKLENIKVIGIIRDGDKVVDSIQKRGAQRYEIALYRWKRAIEIIDYAKTTMEGKMIIVSYDKFIQNTESNLRSIAEFLGVKFNENMLSGHKYIPLYPGHTTIDPSKASTVFNENISQDLTNSGKRYLDLFNKLYSMSI